MGMIDSVISKMANFKAGAQTFA